LGFNGLSDRPPPSKDPKTWAAVFGFLAGPFCKGPWCLVFLFCSPRPRSETPKNAMKQKHRGKFDIGFVLVKSFRHGLLQLFAWLFFSTSLGRNAVFAAARTAKTHQYATKKQKN
jgi:hypothetical protein